ncbi:MULTISPECIES: SHOCT domain-containing protein [unclassified Streptomyces]|uniref:SHOCT domain-containing protein n=1 Tax=unclassified Streptomyces TaxID=2593676 RepID=UPI002ED21708|nr:SHOCT domain-containing protein [Streptomyces sp. NBC_00891]WSY09664.1 SHOCT domain-containing protein [Streptomyces sp. NBC_00890]WSZ11285.1 SHOCT domain-containing protein [Streptomyces sp. NBC_00869]WSZ27727.1 SHOCT domain-containing protein [Streptomyces sp. NBC_00870]
MNRRGPGLIGAAARTAVVAGTASAVSGRVQQRQQARFAEQEAAQQPVQPAAPQPAASQGDDIIGQLERLAALKEQGVLTEAEFEAQKARLLAE